MKLPLASIGLGVVALLLLACAGPLYRLGLLPLPWAFGLMRWAAYLGLATVVVALVTGVLAYRRRQLGHVALTMAGLVIGLTAFAIPYRWQRRADTAPAIYDISTDLENPPAFQALVAQRADAPNPLVRAPDLAQRQRTGYPDIAPLTLPIPSDQAFERALLVVQDAGWEIVDADKQAGRIEATDVTPWFGFRDDVVVRLSPWGSGTRVDVRSVSRMGESDYGTNARRIREFLEALEARSSD